MKGIRLPGNSYGLARKRYETTAQSFRPALPCKAAAFACIRLPKTAITGMESISLYKSISSIPCPPESFRLYFSPLFLISQTTPPV